MIQDLPEHQRTGESIARGGTSVPLMHHVGSLILIQITAKERILRGRVQVTCKDLKSI